MALASQPWEHRMFFVLLAALLSGGTYIAVKTYTEELDHDLKVLTAFLAGMIVAIIIGAMP